VKRALVSAQDLRVLLNLEIATLEACENVTVDEIEVAPEADVDGCNWRVRSFSSGEPGTHARRIAEAIVSAMRWRYNVGRRRGRPSRGP
jgi:hypothetical protein